MIKTTKFMILACLACPVLMAAGEPAVQLEAGHINGLVFCDKNADGRCDCESEGQGIRDMHIQLFTKQCGGTPLQTIHTDKGGGFSFFVPEPGHYYVKVDLDYVCGGRVPTTNNCQQVDLRAGETVTLEPFGYSVLGQ